MPIYIGVGGAWKEFLPGTAIGVSGINKTIKTMHIGVGGVWKQFFVGGAVLTIGQSSDLNSFGFAKIGSAGFSNSFGDIEPDPFNVEGKELVAAASDPSDAYDFRVQITDNPVTGHFTSVTIEDGDGVERNYTSASAATTSDGTVRSWTWGDGSDPVYFTGDTSEEHTISFN